MLVVLLMAFAPLPMVKPVKPMCPAGEWNLTWRGGEGPARFDKDGTFHCVWQGKYWVGTWKLDKGVLRVEESLHASHGGSSPFVWSVKLDAGKWEGEITSSLDALGGDNRFLLKKH